MNRSEAQPEANVPSVARTARLAAEFVLLYGLFPLLGYFVFAIESLNSLRFPLLLVALIGGAAACIHILRRDPTFERRSFTNFRGAWSNARGVLVRAAIAAALMGVVILLVAPEYFLSFPRRAPGTWMAVMAFYPFLSVIPQQIIFRTFLTHRYRELFPTKHSMIAASAGAFGFAHVIFHNPIAVGLTLVGGAILAWTYLRSRSSIAAWMEHVFYGWAVFTLGIGVFFYHGA